MVNPESEVRKPLMPAWETPSPIAMVEEAGTPKLGATHNVWALALFTMLKVKLASDWKTRGCCALVGFVFVASQSPRVSLADVCPLVNDTEDMRVEMLRTVAPAGLIVVTYKSTRISSVSLTNGQTSAK